MRSEAVDMILARLNEAKRNPKRHGDNWTARCPAHEDDNPSLSVSRGRDGRVLVKCHRGCTTEAIVSALGLSIGDLFVERAGGEVAHGAPPPHPRAIAHYDYADEHGEVLFQTVRYEPKDFRQRRPDGAGGWTWRLNGVRRVLYRLPELIEDIAHERPIVVVEGEKDVDALRAIGVSATTSPMGAGKWHDDFATSLENADVVIIPDNDDSGRAHAEKVATSLRGIARRVRTLALPGLPTKGDASDWIAAGGTAERLRELADRAGELLPSLEPPTRRTLRQLLEDPDVTRPPVAIIPRIAWEKRHTLLAAPEKSGKSTFVGFAVAQLANGGEFFGVRCTPRDVLVMGLEEYVGDLVRRLAQFGADPDRVHIVDRFPPGTDTVPKRLALVREHVEAVRPALVIIDTLIAYSEGAISDTSAAAQMQPIVQGLSRLAHELGVAVITMHHARKADGKYRDSSAIGGAVDVIVEIFSPDEAGDATLRRIRARGRVPTENFDVRFDGERYTLATPGDAPLDIKIRDFISLKPGCSNKQVRDVIAGRARAIDDAIARLLERQMIVDDGEPGRHAYRVPDFGADRVNPSGRGRTTPETPTRPLDDTGTTSGRPPDDQQDEHGNANGCRPPSLEGDDPTEPELRMLVGQLNPEP